MALFTLTWEDALRDGKDCKILLLEMLNKTGVKLDSPFRYYVKGKAIILDEVPEVKELRASIKRNRKKVKK